MTPGAAQAWPSDLPANTVARLESLAQAAKSRPTYRKRWITAAIKHWMPLLDECSDIGCDWAEAATHCWRCGCARSLQRCHLIPKALGGTLEPENVMPLCADCHAEAPDTDDRNDFLAWVKKTRNRGCYESYWAERCWREAGIPLPASQKHADAVLLEWLCLIATSAGTHRTHLSTATKVALLKRAYASTPASS